MIFLENEDGQLLVILKPGNIDHLKNGGVVVSPRGSVIIQMTNDAVWLGKQITKANSENILNSEVLDILVKESLQLPEVHKRPFHELIEIIKNGKNTGKQLK